MQNKHVFISDAVLKGIKKKQLTACMHQNITDNPDNFKFVSRRVNPRFL